jgi:hypothetical protein
LVGGKAFGLNRIPCIWRSFRIARCLRNREL